MERKANPNPSPRFEKKHQKIKGNYSILMQYMKSYAATAGHENRISNYMIKIYEHSKHENNIGANKIFAKKQPGNDQGCQNM